MATADQADKSEDPPKPAGREPQPDRPSDPQADRPQTDRATNASHFDDPEDTDAARMSADRRHTVAEALAMFGTRTSGVVIVGDRLEFNGPVTGGDHSAGGGRAAPHLEAVTARTLAQLAEVYVEPSDFGRAGEPFANDHRVLLLGTRARWGNTTTAIRLLDGLPAIYQLRFADDCVPRTRLEVAM